MIDWWTQLAPEFKVFYGIGFIALAVVAVQMLLTLLGFDADRVDGGFDAGLGESAHSSGIGLFSSHTLAAFFLGFGWVGVAGLKSGLPIPGAVGLAFAFGVGAMFAMYGMIRSLLRLQAKGNLDYRSALGEEATVYVTIPGSNQDGGGQIQVMIQGRLTTASARKSSPGAVKPGERVRITEVNGPASFIVEPLTATGSAPGPAE